MKNQLGKLLAGLSIIALSAPIYAHTYGSYIGADVTVTNWDYRQKNTVNFLAPPGTALSIDGYQDVDFDLNDTDVSGEFRAGAFARWADVGWSRGPWLTAIEVFGGPHSASDEYKGTLGLDFDVLNQEVSSKWSYGADIKQGYFINEEWMVFGRAGIIRTRFDVDTSVYSLVDSTTSVRYQDEANLTGFRVGLGVEKFFTDCFSVSLQGIYTQYEDYDSDISEALGVVGSSVEGLAFPDANFTDDLRMEIHAIQFGLGFNYYFG